MIWPTAAGNIRLVAVDIPNVTNPAVISLASGFARDNTRFMLEKVTLFCALAAVSSFDVVNDPALRSCFLCVAVE